MAKLLNPLQLRSTWAATIQKLCSVLLMVAIGISLSGILSLDPGHALPQGNAITDSRTILRQALPVSNPALQELDEKVEAINQDLKYNRWRPTRGDIKKVNAWIRAHQTALVADVPEGEQASVTADFAQLETELEQLQDQVKRKSRGKFDARQTYDQILATLEQLELHWVGAFPFDIPADYTDRPQLLGRAKVKLATTRGDMILTLDGYSAPITAGNFADLVQRGFYDDMRFDRIEDFYLIQAGNPPGDADGYVDPATGEMRTIPMEIRVQGEIAPRYGKTLSEWGLWDADPVLPFSAKGTVAMAPYPDHPNTASSQFFLFIAEPDLTPAGLNLLDGRYAAFGYITSGADLLGKLTLEDKIIQAEILSGSENLKNVT